jgi:hypothetical protein
MSNVTNDIAKKALAYRRGIINYYAINSHETSNSGLVHSKCSENG